MGQQLHCIGTSTMQSVVCALPHPTLSRVPPTHPPPTSFLNKLLGMRLEDQDLLFSYFAASMDKARTRMHCSAACCCSAERSS